MAGERHSGVGYEILLDVRVPAAGPGHQGFPARDGALLLGAALAPRGGQRLGGPPAGWLWMSRSTRPSTSSPYRWRGGPGPVTRWEGGGRGKKRRKKKLPKTSSSTSSRCRERNQGAVEYAEDGEDEVTIEYEQRAGVLRIHTANTFTLHAEPLNSFHCKEVTGYTGPGEAAPGMEEVHKYFECGFPSVGKP